MTKLELDNGDVYELVLSRERLARQWWIARERNTLLTFDGRRLSQAKIARVTVDPAKIMCVTGSPPSE